MMAPHHDNDEVLMNLLREGNRQAFAAIYNRYVDELYRHAKRVLANKEDCEEILQEVFEYLWKNHKTINIKSLRAYLYKAVANKVTDHLKKGYLHKRYVEHFQLFEAVYSNADNTESVEQIIESGLRQLPERVQLAIRLRLTENLTNDEIAQRMQVTNKTIENYMHQVYTHFRATYSLLLRANT